MVVAASEVADAGLVDAELVDAEFPVCVTDPDEALDEEVEPPVLLSGPTPATVNLMQSS